METKMKLIVTGTNTEITPNIRSFIERKLDKFSRHMPSIIETKVEITEEKTKAPAQRYLVKAIVDANGPVFHGEERGSDLFVAINKVSDVMIRQLKDFRDKAQNKGKGVSFARNTSSEPLTPETPARKVVKMKRFTLKPMSADEAIDQMEVLGHDFFLFVNADTEKINLVYLRKDGNYGIIETEIV